MNDDVWPSSWRSLAWPVLGVTLALEATKGLVRWTIHLVSRQMDETPRMKVKR